MSLKLESLKRLILYAICGKEIIVSILSVKLYYLTTSQIFRVLITLIIILLNIKRTQSIMPLRLFCYYLMKSK